MHSPARTTSDVRARASPSASMSTSFIGHLLLTEDAHYLRQGRSRCERNLVVVPAQRCDRRCHGRPVPWVHERVRQFAVPMHVFRLDAPRARAYRFAFTSTGEATMRMQKWMRLCSVACTVAYATPSVADERSMLFAVPVIAGDPREQRVDFYDLKSNRQGYVVISPHGRVDTYDRLSNHTGERAHQSGRQDDRVV